MNYTLNYHVHGALTGVQDNSWHNMIFQKFLKNTFTEGREQEKLKPFWEFLESDIRRHEESS